jgi:hypothetical protein
VSIRGSHFHFVACGWKQECLQPKSNGHSSRHVRHFVQPQKALNEASTRQTSETDLQPCWLGILAEEPGVPTSANSLTRSSVSRELSHPSAEIGIWVPMNLIPRMDLNQKLNSVSTSVTSFVAYRSHKVSSSEKSTRHDSCSSGIVTQSSLKC